MDPNVTLEGIRRSIAAVNELQDAGELDHQSLAQEAVSLAFLAEALDQWLSMGGFKPTAWQF